MTEKLRYQHVRFRTYSPSSVLDVLMGDGAAQLSGGFGGWQVVQRPKRISLTEWNGVDPTTQTIPVMFDGWTDERSVEPEIARLEAMSRASPGELEPPIVRIAGPIHHPELDWVINDIQHGETIRRRHDGRRVRQASSVALMHYIEDTQLTAAKRHRGRDDLTARFGHPALHRTVIVRRGDTLPRIAARELGKASRWREIATLNHIRDPKHLKVGQQLKMPRPQPFEVDSKVQAVR